MAACSWYAPTDPCDERRRDERDAFRDRALIPQRSILLRERDQLAVRPGPRGAPRIGEQHQREQPGDLAHLRQQRCARARASRIASFDRSRALEVRADAARRSPR